MEVPESRVPGSLEQETRDDIVGETDSAGPEFERRGEGLEPGSRPALFSRVLALARITVTSCASVVSVAGTGLGSAAYRPAAAAQQEDKRADGAARGLSAGDWRRYPGASQLI